MIKLTPKGKSRYQQIIQEAWSLFSEKGYAMSSMDDIAAACKCYVGNIYNYFPTKEHILYEGIKEATSGAVAINEEIKKSDSLNPTQKLRGLITRQLEARASTTYKDLFFEYRCNLQPQHVKDLIELRDAYESSIRSIILEGIDRGDFRSMDEKMAVVIVSAFIERFKLWYSPRGTMTPSQVADTVLDLLLYGIRPAK